MGCLKTVIYLFFRWLYFYFECVFSDISCFKLFYIMKCVEK
jgi:hypothetical protein